MGRIIGISFIILSLGVLQGCASAFYTTLRPFDEMNVEVSKTVTVSVPVIASQANNENQNDIPPEERRRTLQAQNQAQASNEGEGKKEAEQDKGVEEQGAGNATPANPVAPATTNPPATVTTEERVVRETVSCDTNDIEVAQKCVNMTLKEFSQIQDDIRGLRATTAYTAVGLGTATAGVIAYEGGTGVLKGLAVVTGGMLGVNGVAKPEEKRKILEEGARQLRCVKRAVNGITNSSDGISNALVSNYGWDSGDASYSALNRVLNSNADAINFRPTSGEDGEISDLQEFQATEINSHYQEMFFNVKGALSSLNQAKSTLGQSMTDANIDIRHDVQSKLDATIPLADNTSIENNRNQIIDLVGKIVAQRAKLKEDLKKKTVPQNDGQELVVQFASAIVEETGGITETLKQCVGKAETDAIEEAAQ